MTIYVLGRFPPPIDGQTLATERLADLMETELDVERIDIQPPQTSAVESRRQLIKRTSHFLKLRPRIKTRLAEAPDATVLWPAISPDVPGHFRDVTITVPAFQPDQHVYAVVHRGNFHRMFERPLTAVTAKRLVERISGFVFNTNHLSDRCAQWIPASKRIIIPNTVDDDLIFSDGEVSEKQEERTRRDRFSVLFISHMLPSKGYLDVLDGLILMQQKGVEVEGHFVGGWQHPQDREAFFERAREGGVQNDLTHHGAVAEREKIKELYRRADALLLPTYYPNEAQPHVLIEALNAGTPVVTTRHAGIPEMIRDGHEGLLVPAREPAALAKAVERLAQPDVWRELSRQARKTYVETYSPEDVRRRWRMLIETAHTQAAVG